MELARFTLCWCGAKDSLKRVIRYYQEKPWAFVDTCDVCHGKKYTLLCGGPEIIGSTEYVMGEAA